MRLIFLGSGEFAVPTLEWLAQSEHEVALVLTQPDRPSGRGRKSNPTPVKAAALKLGLDVRALPDVNDKAIVDDLLRLDVRLGLVIAFGQKIGPAILGGLPAGCINLHGSLLPKYRGAAPIHRAILGGESETGLTVFRLVERMDAGPIFAETRVEIHPEETAGELNDRLALMGPDIMGRVLTEFEGEAEPQGIVQNEDEASKAPKLKKSDGFLNFDRPAKQIVTQILGLSPWPGASCIFAPQSRGKRENVLLTRARGCNESVSYPAGTITDDLRIATGSGTLELLEIKPSGARNMFFKDFVNGRHVQPGDRFCAPEGA
jgi:methionyl-tRNA formyltransferase